MLSFSIFKNFGIITQLIIWFLIIALVPLLIVAYLGNNSSQKLLHEETAKYLSAVANKKGDKIESYLTEIERDIASLSRDRFFVEALIKLDTIVKEEGFDSLEYANLDREIRVVLSQYQQHYEYYDTFFISTDGDVLFTLKKEDDFGTNLKTGPYRDTELASAFDRAKTLLHSDISDFKYYTPSKDLAAFIAAPIYKDGKIFGVLALQINTEEIFRLTKDYSGLGETGEVVLGSKISDTNNEMVFINPLRFDPEAAFKRKVVFGSYMAQPIQEAVQGNRGSGITIDYRNEEVLAVWKYLPSLRLGMVAKIDTSEIFAPADQLSVRLQLIIIASILIIIIIAALIAYSISKPIRDLRKGVKIIGKGDLEYRIEVKSKNEVGKLAEAFNQMTEDLKMHSKEMAQKNKELEQNKEELEATLKQSEEGKMAIEKMNQSMTGRELKMIELKQEIQKLKEQGK